MTSYLSG